MDSIVLGTLAAAVMAMMVVMTLRLAAAFRRYRIKRHYTAALEAPSVSVCIAARNETHAMTQCLERVLESDYTKLEIIVYDDSSADDTSIIVRSFAHAGVRFVPGSALPEGWLGRNHAIDTLVREASGTYVVFLDVDTYIEPSTISQLVGYMITENLAMASVIPGRNDTWRSSVIFSHLRYFWELLLARRAAPATSSALWMIKRHTLLDTIGGITPHKSEVRPEEHVAALVGKAYHCLVNNAELGVTYEKKWRSQAETSRRLLFPMMGGMWYGAIIGIAGLLLLNVPFFIVLSSSLFGWSIIQSIALVFVVAGMAMYAIYTKHMWRSRWWLGALLWPYIILQELFLFVGSVWGYARHTINWKGRPITASPTRVDSLEIDE
jgi:glycosyltransferase involved in cell wall biosynthesis